MNTLAINIKINDETDVTVLSNIFERNNIKHSVAFTYQPDDVIGFKISGAIFTIIEKENDNEG